MILNDIYPTIQGEGVFAGMPVVLIRLHGCSVGCPWCDTMETWKPVERWRKSGLAQLLDARAHATKGKPLPFWCEASESQIASAAREMAPNVSVAMVTGGEPAEQDLAGLNRELGERGFMPTLETSGTADGFFDQPWSWICVSPKLDMPGGKPVLEDAIMRADEVKCVITDAASLDRHTAWVKARQIRMKPGHIISLQPESQDAEATRLCVEACIKEGWRLSIQAHKYIGVA